MVRVKNIILLVFVILIYSTICFADVIPNISSGIEAYQAGNYEDCISKMKFIVKDDPTAVVGYYYLGLAYTKTGQKLLAIENYNKVININSDKTMTALARQGKNTLGVSYVNKVETQLNEIKDNIKEEEDGYNPIMEDMSESKNVKTSDSTPLDEPKTTHVIRASDYAKTTNPPPQNSNSQPTNDDIVNAIRTLQKAGLLQNGAAGLIGGQNQMSMPMDSRTQQMNSMLMMMNGGNNNNNMMQMMPYMNNGGKVDPQMMQMMLMNQMMPNFSSGGNNGGGY